MIIKSIMNVTCTCLALASFSATAALQTRLGGAAVYDDVADLTWLSEVVLGGQYFDIENNQFSDIEYTFSEATTIAGTYVIDGIGNWRLPETSINDSSCISLGGTNSTGSNCIGGELGNMFYNVLGGVFGDDISTTHNSNFDFFNTFPLQGQFWTGTINLDNYDHAGLLEPLYSFSLKDGAKESFKEFNQDGNGEYTYNTVWLVQSGDISAVPVPAAAWLFGSGLISLVGLARRKA